MTDITSLFKFIIIVQLFYALSVTLIAHAMPADTLDKVSAFSDLAEDIDLEQVSNNIQDSVQSQINIPVIELGALIFYSGNILLDLLLNFFFAIPQMITLLINSFLFFFNLETIILATIQLFFSVLITSLYFIGLLQLLINVRSGRGTGLL